MSTRSITMRLVASLKVLSAVRFFCVRSVGRITLSASGKRISNIFSMRYFPFERLVVTIWGTWMVSSWYREVPPETRNCQWSSSPYGDFPGKGGVSLCEWTTRLEKSPHNWGSKFMNSQEVPKQAGNYNHDKSEEQSRKNYEKLIKFPAPTEENFEFFPYVREGIHIGRENYANRQIYGHFYVYPRGCSAPRRANTNITYSLVSRNWFGWAGQYWIIFSVFLTQIFPKILWRPRLVQSVWISGRCFCEISSQRMYFPKPLTTT